MKKIFSLIMCILSLSAYSQTETRNINQTFISTDTIYPFRYNDYCSGIFMDGSSKLFSKDGYIRVILLDNNEEEWLIYERNNLYATETTSKFQNASHETFLLDNIIPKAIIIESNQAVIELSDIRIDKKLNTRTSIKDTYNSIFAQKNIQIANRINDTLSLYKKAWRADTTFLSNTRYQDKKRFFPNGIPDLKGWDYYAYGYYSPLNDDTPEASDNIIKEFDWRTRHGANIQTSYYYNPDGSGWIPRRRYGQVCAECWAFSTTYSVEAMVNLYFNKQYNDELSVQDILSCSNGGSWDNGGNTQIALNYVKNTGIVNDQCFPFKAYQDVPCEDKCSEPIELVRVNNYSAKLMGEENIKRNLITKGPLVTSIYNWGHAVSMVGFGIVKAGDPVLNADESNFYDVYVTEDSPDIGKPYYIFKQSYATYGYDESAFCNIIIDANSNSMHAFSISTPINSLLYDTYGVDCVDFDGDGYYNWGIGDKPTNCPSCPDERDSDDYSALFGPYNEKFESIILCENYIYSEEPEYITSSRTWCTKKYINHDIIIDNDCVLTITDTVYLGENTKIIVKPGGKLVLDNNSLLTSLCDKMWQGIQVWGIDSLHQYLSNGQYLQGVLELKNGATIENAVCAVDLWNPLDVHSEGGIVWAEDAIFRNNAKAVRSLNYSNYSPSSGTEAQNASWFRNCSFILDSEYIGNETFHNHVELNNVDGIKFYACSFSADNSVSQLASSISAIYASSAGFTVTSECSSPSFPCPENNLIYSTFNGFDNAIHVTNNGGSVRTFSVSNSEFWNNERGIYATNTGYATIIKNIFNVGNNAQCNYGVYVDGVTNFCIEENNFLRNPSTTNRTYGIAVENSGSYNDIYLNHFNNLYCGNISIGNNIVSGNNGLGLTYTCNTNSGNTHDFGVLRDGTYGNIDNSQGSSSLAAANTFSASQYHFYNKGNNNLTYYYKGSGNKIPSRKYGVILATATIDNECKSHYDLIGGGSGGGMMSVGKTDSLKNKYENSFSSFNRLNSLGTYKIEKDSTQKMLQEAQMSMLQRECLLAAGDIVRSNLNKEERDFNELREWLGKSNDISSARMIIASYIQQKDFVNAIALAKKLPATYDLQGEELNEFYDYLEIIRLHESLSETNRTALQLSDYEVTLLENIAENGTGASKAMADAILAENRGLPTIVITLCPTIPNFASVARGSGESEMISDTAFKVELSPNPATTNVEVSYTLPEGMTSATLVMTNTLGVNVMTAQLYGNNGETTLSLEELPTGIYFYTIKCGENVKTGKLVKRN